MRIKKDAQDAPNFFDTGLISGTMAQLQLVRRKDAT